MITLTRLASTLSPALRRELVTKAVQTVTHGESSSNQFQGELLLFLPHHNWLIKLNVTTSMSSEGEHLTKKDIAKTGGCHPLDGWLIW